MLGVACDPPGRWLWTTDGWEPLL